MRTIDWDKPFYGSHNCDLKSTKTMMGFSMTILMGTYSNDKTDVALIADRRRSPANVQRMKPIEDAHKTLRLGPECSIGFAGAEPLQNGVLAELFGIPWPPQSQSLIEDLVVNEQDYILGFDEAIDALNQIAPKVVDICRPPASETIHIILAGKTWDGIPGLVGVSAKTGWKVDLCFGDVWSPPRGMSSYAEQRMFDNATQMPGMDYDDRMRAAVKYCSKYPSVNNHYIIRRLSTGFSQEAGSV